jgi:hypothetical protein
MQEDVKASSRLWIGVVQRHARLTCQTAGILDFSGCGQRRDARQQDFG